MSYDLAVLDKNKRFDTNEEFGIWWYDGLNDDGAEDIDIPHLSRHRWN